MQSAEHPARAVGRSGPDGPRLQGAGAQQKADVMQITLTRTRAEGRTHANTPQDADVKHVFFGSVARVPPNAPQVFPPLQWPEGEARLRAVEAKL